MLKVKIKRKKKIIGNNYICCFVSYSSSIRRNSLDLSQSLQSNLICTCQYPPLFSSTCLDTNLHGYYSPAKTWKVKLHCKRHHETLFMNKIIAI